MGLFDFLKPKSDKERILKKYYSNYPEKPYISEGRDIKSWEQLIAFDPKKLVSKDKMQRNSDGLLPGHIYQIYWIDKYKPNKQIPVYFEYEFGIDFEAEKKFLEQSGYIFSDNATDKGKYVLEKYHDIIERKNNQNKLPKLNLQKELATFDKEQKKLAELGIESNDSRSEKIGFVIQNNAIVDYRNKDFESAKQGFLEAMNTYDFYTPGGVDYLAKIYRKEKDYQAEIDLIEKAIEKFNSKSQVNWSKSGFANLKKRLAKAKELLKK
ncbi:TPA: hypothetical protein U1Y26_001552 [Streptococcus suis]|nr:hypothetical protein [Streptococcus suis]HEM4334877.1 hypothetical protein [Streptococcus suis]